MSLRHAGAGEKTGKEVVDANRSDNPITPPASASKDPALKYVEQDVRALVDA